MIEPDLAAMSHYRDCVLPFSLDRHARGRIVRLDAALDQIIHQHAYPRAVAQLLAELVTLAVTLAAALKYDGVFTLQVKGDGPIRLMVADVTSQGALRGYAQFDPAHFAEDWPADTPLPRLTGRGYLAFTVDQGDFTDRYQGIVELEGSSLSECLHHYFRTSEQLEASFAIAAERTEGGWRSGGLMIQRLPLPSSPKYPLEEDEEQWRQSVVFMASARRAELLDPGLAMEDILRRLFHDFAVRVYPAHSVRAQCRCSDERVRTILLSLDAEERKEMAVDGVVTVTCEFCNRTYRYTPAELEGDKE
jgi:molecular chaperone Hsp33